jgi:hypothetical protein
VRRPFCEERLALEAALVDGPGTSRQLAQRSGVGFKAATATLHNMCTAGDAVKTHSVRVAGCKRPVPVYARALRACMAQDSAESEPINDLISAWYQRPAAVVLQASRGAAM